MHRSAQGNQLNYILLEANEALFGPAVDEYVRELKAEKGWLLLSCGGDDNECKITVSLHRKYSSEFVTAAIIYVTAPHMHAMSAVSCCA